MPTIEVAALPDRLPSRQVRDLAGKIVMVVYGGAGTIPGKFFPFARVRSIAGSAVRRQCPHCDNESAIYRIELEWEALDYDEPDNIACEGCFVGIVVSGHEYIAFGADDPCPDPVEVSLGFDLSEP